MRAFLRDSGLVLLTGEVSEPTPTERVTIALYGLLPIALPGLIWPFLEAVVGRVLGFTGATAVDLLVWVLATTMSALVILYGAAPSRLELPWVVRLRRAALAFCRAILLVVVFPVTAVVLAGVAIAYWPFSVAFIAAWIAGLVALTREWRSPRARQARLHADRG